MKEWLKDLDPLLFMLLFAAFCLFGALFMGLSMGHERRPCLRTEAQWVNEPNLALGMAMKNMAMAYALPTRVLMDVCVEYGEVEP